MTHPHLSLHADLQQIVDAAIAAVAPASLLDAATARGVLDSIAGAPLVVVAAGKAAWPIAIAFSRAGRAGGIQHGLVAGPRTGSDVLPDGFEWFEAGHPDPNAASVAAGRRALEMVRRASPDSTLIVLLSGGASALFVDPAGGLSVDDKMTTARALMDAGIAIDGLNCVRKHLSGIKGGRLGAAAARSLTLAISDVHGPVPDDPSVIGSGPTIADPTTYRDALDVIGQAERDGPRSPPASRRVSRAAVDHLERGARGEWPETIKPGDPRLSRADYHVVGTRLTAIEGARAVAERLGYAVAVLPDATSGNARDAAEAFVAEGLRRAEGVPGRFCVLASGETTVRVTGSGRGGRNQEFALAVAPLLADLARPAALASAGTDGIDGPTDAAGAIADRSTLERSRRAGLDWRASLADNDAYHFFAPLGDLIMRGPTGTNVGDVHVLLLS